MVPLLHNEWWVFQMHKHIFLLHYILYKEYIKSDEKFVLFILKGVQYSRIKSDLVSPPSKHLHHHTDRYVTCLCEPPGLWRARTGW